MFLRCAGCRCFDVSSRLRFPSQQDSRKVGSSCKSDRKWIHERRLPAQSEASSTRERRTIDTRRRTSGNELAHAHFPILESGRLSVLGKFHRTSETAFEQRSALPDRLVRAVTRLIRFATASDLACRRGDIQQTRDDDYHDRERRHCPVAK